MSPNRSDSNALPSARRERPDDSQFPESESPSSHIGESSSAGFAAANCYDREQPASASLGDRNPQKQGGLLRRTMLSVAIWTFYVPHLKIVRLLGPRLGLHWVRLMSRLHWLLSCFGVQRDARSMLALFKPYVTSKLSVSEILRKHLKLKHEYFARVRLLDQRDPNWGDTIAWDISPEILDQISEIRARGQSVILVGYHFGFFRLLGRALSNRRPEFDPLHVSHRTAHYSSHATGRIARLALRRAFEADLNSGARVHYVEGNASVLRLVRMLKAGDIAALGADGTFTTDFVDVPFMGGKLRAPCGWARLAAATGATVLIMADAEVAGRRKVSVYDDVRVADSSPESIYGAVAAAALILDRLVSQYPWEWHPWQRINLEVAADGSTVFVLRELGRTSMDSRAIVAQAKEDVTSRNIDNDPSKATRPGALTWESTGPARKKPRIAIVTNSLTPYRVQLHEQLVREIPEIELWSLATHSNSFQRWNKLDVTPEIRPIEFGTGQPTDQQTQIQFAVREWRKAGRVIRWLKENHVSAVFCQGCGDVGRLRILRWCRQNNVPCYLTGDCNIRCDRRKGLRRLVKTIVFRAAVAWSCGVMPCGAYGKAFFERYGARGKPSFSFPFIPNIDLFRRPSKKSMEHWNRKLNPKGRRRRVLFCGRLMHVKRPDLALQAFADIADERPEWDLVIAGDGLLRESLELQVPVSLRNRVIWTGFVDDTAELAGLYAQCDALLLPSEHEPWGVVVVEAAAAGLAIIASDVVGASPELVRPGRNGAVFPAGNLEALVQALKEVTLDERIDTLKKGSSAVLREWLAYADPTRNLRSALIACGVACNGYESGDYESIAVTAVDAS